MEEKTITLVLDDLKTLRDRNMIDKNMRIAECIDNGIHTIRKLQQQDKRLRMLLDIKMDNSGYKPIIGFDDIAKETIELVYHDITKERDTYKKQLDDVKEVIKKYQKSLSEDNTYCKENTDVMNKIILQIIEREKTK